VALCLATIVAVLAGAAPTWAEEVPAIADQKQQARGKLVEGDGLLKQGEYQRALLAFKAAYDLFPSQKIQYDFALAYLGMGRAADALTAIDAFLSGAKDAAPENVAKAKALRETLQGRVGMLRVLADVVDAAIVVDGRELGTTAAKNDIPLDPGPHLLLVDRGHGTSPFTQRLEIAAAAVLTVPVHLAGAGSPGPVAAPASSPNGQTAIAPSAVATGSDADARRTPSDPAMPDGNGGRWARNAGIATASAGVLLLGGGLLFGLAARSASADVSRQYDPDRDSAGKRDATLQWVGYGVGLAAIVTGAVLFVHGTSTGPTDGLHASIGPGGVSAGGSF